VAAPAPRLGSVGTGTPTGDSPINSLSAVIDADTTTPNGFAFFDLDPAVPGVDTVYVADEGATTSASDGAIRKFSFDGASWTDRGNAAAADVRGLTGFASGGTVTLYGSTGGGTTTGCPANCSMPATGGGAIYSMTDSSGSTGTLSASATTIATPAPNTGFRGIALVPEAPTSAPPVCTGASASTSYATPVSVTIACSDPDGDAVTRRVVRGPAKGTLGAFDNATGAVVYTPKAGQSGDDSFTIAGSDGNSESDPVTVTVAIGTRPVGPSRAPMRVRLGSARYSRRAIELPLACVAGGALKSCRGSLRFDLVTPVAGMKRIGTVWFGVATGRKKTLKLPLGTAARRRLAGRKLKVNVVVTLAQPGGATGKSYKSLTVRPPRAWKPRSHR
jgi:hypothetical protein